MSLINSIASWLLKKRMYQIELFMRHPHESQLEVFHQLLSGAADTVWGRKYGYRDIGSWETYRSRVPVQTYENLFPWIERQLMGEANVLWPGEVLWFSKSSGTTNDKSKFIPVSQASLDECHFKGGKDMLAMYLNHRPDSRLFTGKCMPISGSTQAHERNQRAFFGDLSAVLIENTPFPFEFFRATSKKTALLGDWEEKLGLMCGELLDANITSMVGVPTWALVLLHRLMEMQGAADIHEIWPGLEVFFHGGVSFKPYRSQFEKVIRGPQMWYYETYNASEGFFGIQAEPGREDLLLMLDYGIFYEFAPLTELDREFPDTLRLDQVQTGVDYALIISTNGGLWRYLIGDTVRFTSTDPYKIIVSGRTRQYINTFGEELMVDNAETAVAAACQETGAVIRNYTVAPVYLEGNEKGAHEWLIEFAAAPDDLARFGQVLDGRLKQLNSDYEAKRHRDLALTAPRIRVMPEGSFFEWMKMRGRLGGQNKVPRLSNHREYADSILSMVQAMHPQP